MLSPVDQDWLVKSTPTFRLYRGSTHVQMLSGTKDNKLLNALLEQLKEGERGKDWVEVTHEEVSDWEGESR